MFYVEISSLIDWLKNLHQNKAIHFVFKLCYNIAIKAKILNYGPCLDDAVNMEPLESFDDHFK